jgi:hypothetical protein
MRRTLWQPAYARAFWRILSQNAGAVRALLFGHVHAQEFRTWGNAAYEHDNGDMPEDISSAPPLLTFGSVSPIYGSNPVSRTPRTARRMLGIAARRPRRCRAGHSVAHAEKKSS